MLIAWWLISQFEEYQVWLNMLHITLPLEFMLRCVHTNHCNCVYCRISVVCYRLDSYFRLNTPFFASSFHRRMRRCSCRHHTTWTRRFDLTKCNQRSEISLLRYRRENVAVYTEARLLSTSPLFFMRSDTPHYVVAISIPVLPSAAACNRAICPRTPTAVNASHWKIYNKLPLYVEFSNRGVLTFHDLVPLRWRIKCSY